MGVKTQIKDYILNFITYGDPIDNDQSLLGGGLIDSSGAMELVEYIENTFNIEVLDDEIDPDNLDTINLATAYVERKLEES